MEMVWVNDVIPFKGYKAMALWPVVFVRTECYSRFDNEDMNHERIHLRQQVEMLVVGIVIAVILALVGCGWWSMLAVPLFLECYGLEYLLRLLLCWNTKKAYRGISFEQEAYNNEQDMDYLKKRKLFCWVKYLFRR